MAVLLTLRISVERTFLPSATSTCQQDNHSFATKLSQENHILSLLQNSASSTLGLPCGSFEDDTSWFQTRGQPGGRRVEAPFRVDRDGGAGPGCARNGAGGTPALPGGRLLPSFLLLEGAWAGLPGRGRVDSAEPSRLVVLRVSSWMTLFFFCFRQARVNPNQPDSAFNSPWCWRAGGSGWRSGASGRSAAAPLP